jgi:nucleoside-diphosphate-sugar epimerase
MILVTGATGNVGRPLVTQLLHREAPVRAVTRNAATASLPAVSILGRLAISFAAWAADHAAHFGQRAA